MTLAVVPEIADAQTADAARCALPIPRFTCQRAGRRVRIVPRYGVDPLNVDVGYLWVGAPGAPTVVVQGGISADRDACATAGTPRPDGGKHWSAVAARSTSTMCACWRSTGWMPMTCNRLRCPAKTRRMPWRRCWTHWASRAPRLSSVLRTARWSAWRSPRVTAIARANSSRWPARTGRTRMRRRNVRCNAASSNSILTGIARMKPCRWRANWR